MKLKQLGLIFLLIGMCFFENKGAILLQGDVSSETESFSFPIGSHLAYSGGSLTTANYLAVGAAEDIANDYAVSLIASTNVFVPLAPSRVKLNGTADQVNPFYGKSISLLGHVGERLMLVPVASTSSLYLINTLPASIGSVDLEVISAENIKDAGGTETINGALAIDWGSTYTEGGSAMDYIYVAANGNSVSFGQAGGGIAVLTYTTVNKQAVITQVDQEAPSSKGLISKWWQFPKWGKGDLLYLQQIKFKRHKRLKCEKYKNLSKAVEESGIELGSSKIPLVIVSHMLGKTNSGLIAFEKYLEKKKQFEAQRAVLKKEEKKIVTEQGGEAQKKEEVYESPNNLEKEETPDEMFDKYAKKWLKSRRPYELPHLMTLRSPIRASLMRAAALDVATDAAKIGSNLANMAASVDLNWSSLIRLYIALEVTSGAATSDGGRAVVLGRQIRETNQLVFDPIAPDACFDDKDRILGKTGAGVSIAIKKVRTMSTSTRLSYLICVRREGSSDRAYALPVVNLNGSTASTNHGTIAAISADPTEQWGSVDNLINRSFTTPATTLGDIPLATDDRVMVGADSLLTDTIQDIWISGDCVFVATGGAGNNQVAGIFYSQALFDTKGRISNWTQWQRAGGTTCPIFGFAIQSQGSVSFLTGDDEDSVNKVERTLWSDGSKDGLFGGTTSDDTVGMVNQVRTELSSNIGGVQRFFDMPYTTPGFAQTVGDRLSMMIATGLKKIVLVESGCDDASSNFGPNTGDFSADKRSYTAGAVTSDPVSNTKLMIFSGGVLDDLGPVSAAEIAQATQGAHQYGWIFVGGVSGLAVLSNADGTGWDAAAGLKNGFDGITTGMSFKKVGNYEFILKLVADGYYLYVLTTKKLDRIDLSDASFPITTLATVSNIYYHTGYDNFADCLISNNFALLATSHGLYRVGNGKNISVDSEATLSWTLVDVPEGIQMITKLFVVTPSGREQDSATAESMVYVLSAYGGYNLSEVNRFCLHDASAGVASDTIEPLAADLFRKDIPSFFVNYGMFRNYFVTDGSLYFASRSKNVAIPPLMELLPTGYVDGNIYLVRSSSAIDLNLANALSMGKIFRCSASGAWIVSGDFGIKMDE